MAVRTSEKRFNFFSLMARPLPPPPLNGPYLLFFAASIRNQYISACIFQNRIFCKIIGEAVILDQQLQCLCRLCPVFAP